MNNHFFNEADAIKSGIFNAKNQTELTTVDRRLNEFMLNFDYMDDLSDGESPQIYSQTVDYLFQLVDAKRQKSYK